MVLSMLPSATDFLLCHARRFRAVWMLQRCCHLLRHVVTTVTRPAGEGQLLSLETKIAMLRGYHASLLNSVQPLLVVAAESSVAAVNQNADYATSARSAVAEATRLFGLTAKVRTCWGTEGSCIRTSAPCMQVCSPPHTVLCDTRSPARLTGHLRQCALSCIQSHATICIARGLSV
jgi:hypothetical protein